MMNAYHHSNTGNTRDCSCRTNEEDANPVSPKLSPPTKFHGRNHGIAGAQPAQPFENKNSTDKRRLIESSHLEFGRIIARDEAAHWSCTAKELEEISASVADHLLMLMKLKT